MISPTSFLLFNGQAFVFPGSISLLEFLYIQLILFLWLFFFNQLTQEIHGFSYLCLFVQLVVGKHSILKDVWITVDILLPSRQLKLSQQVEFHLGIGERPPEIVSKKVEIYAPCVFYVWEFYSNLRQFSHGEKDLTLMLFPFHVSKSHFWQVGKVSHMVGELYQSNGVIIQGG